MIMVVMGAGASYDSNPALPALKIANDGRMPLASELFSIRKSFRSVLSKFGECDAIVPYLQPRDTDFSIERELQWLADDAAGNPVRHKQLAAVRYYLHVLINQCEEQWIATSGGITNHKTFLDQLRRREAERICLVTFNYDTLIERALHSVGVAIKALPDFISNDYYKLIKLHGSVNWAHRVGLAIPPIYSISKAATTHWLIDNAKDLDVDTHQFQIISEFPMSFEREEVTSITRSGHQEISQRNVGLYPAIAIPVENKDGFECPAEHVQSLQECLPLVNKIIVVGWRATEQPFLKLLAANLPKQHGAQPKCLVVAENTQSANVTIANLQQANIAGDFSLYNAGFTDFVVRREATSFIAG